MINQVSYNQTAFTGRSFRNIEEIEDFSEKAFTAVKKKVKPRYDEKVNEAYKAYANIVENPSNVKLEKKFYGYGTKDSIPLERYTGTKNKNAGLSTEGGGYGGGWIKASIDTPLSTADVHTCAAVNLINESTNEQFLYHVFHGTTAEDIEKFLLEKFPDFNSVNIVPGNMYHTNKTVNNILSALDNINKKAERHFYHFSAEDPEIVAHKGKLSYIERKNDTMTFNEVTDNFT